MGRPSHLTQPVIDIILDLVAKGNYAETAAAFAGIDGSTLRKWITKGKRNEGPQYEAFFTALNRARAQAEVRDLELLSRSDQWQSIAWRIERRNPTKWGRTTNKPKEPKEPKPERTLAEVEVELAKKLAALAAATPAAKTKGRPRGGKNRGNQP